MTITRWKQKSNTDWTQIALLKRWLYILFLPCWGRCCLSTRKHLAWNSPKMPGETSFTSYFLKTSIRMESETSNIHDSWNLHYQANSWSPHIPWKIANLNFHLYCFRIRDMTLLGSMVGLCAIQSRFPGSLLAEGSDSFIQHILDTFVVARLQYSFRLTMELVHRRVLTTRKHRYW